MELEPRPEISELLFTKGLLAALYAQGNERFITHQDEHQQAFKRVVETLENMRKEGVEGTERMPSWFQSLFTDKYPDFDNAILELQKNGITRAVAPYFMEVELLLSDNHAEVILQKFTPPEQEVLKVLAKAFTGVAAEEIA